MTEPDPAEFYTTSTEGYLGAGGFYGSKSKTRLYGADLTSELRAQFKRHNIKNVTVRMGRGSDVIVTIKAEAGDMIDFDTFRKSVEDYKFEAKCSNNWIYYIDKDGIDHSIHYDSFLALPEAEQKEIKEGNFREDLFHRLNVIPIDVPALNDRLEDIPLLVDYFTGQICAEQGIAPKAFDDAAIKALQSKNWTGNIRQLRNVVERLIILAGAKITKEDVDLYA
jgi:hypothetical protein